MRRRVLVYGALATGILIAAGVAIAAFGAMSGALIPGGGQTQSAACAPAPCADVQHYQLWISDVKTGGGLVSMQIAFRNSSDSTHADPSDLQLVDSQNHTSSAVFDAPGCARWSRTEFNNGAKLGPLPLCFRPATTAGHLTIRWTPDFGFFCCQTDIKLT